MPNREEEGDLELGDDESSSMNEKGRYFGAQGLALTLTLLYIVEIVVLILLRAVVPIFSFVSMAWIFLLALIPLTPWLIPALAPVAGRVAPFIRTVTLPGGIEISLRDATRPVAGLGVVESVLTTDHLVHGLTATPTPFTTTDAMAVIQGIQGVRGSGAEAVVVDLAEGAKWRLPNLYFLAWILANDPVTKWLVFTETRASTTSVFVGICAASDLTGAIETVYAAYAGVITRLEFSDPTQLQNHQRLTNEFNKIVQAVVGPPGTGEGPTLAWVTSGDLSGLLGPHLVTTSIRWTGELDRAGLEKIVRSTAPYLAATTADGQFRGLLGQRQIVLEFTRLVLQTT